MDAKIEIIKTKRKQVIINLFLKTHIFFLLFSFTKSFVFSNVITTFVHSFKNIFLSYITFPLIGSSTIILSFLIFFIIMK